MASEGSGPGVLEKERHQAMHAMPCAQAAVTATGDRVGRPCDATPSGHGQDAGVLSGRRTMKKEDADLIADDFALANQHLAEDRRADFLLPPPVALEMQMGCDEQLSKLEQTSKANEANSAFTAFFTSAIAQGTFDFESAMEELFDSSLRLRFDDNLLSALPADVTAEVMMQANMLLSKFRAKDDRLLGNDAAATDALQGILLSLRILLCRVEHAPKQGEKRKADSDNQREELMKNVLGLFESCLRRWSMAAIDESGADGAPRRAKQAWAGFSDHVSLAASASLRALIKGSRDASNEKHCVSIIRLSIHAILCDQLPAVQAEGLKLLKSIFCLNVKYHETILEEVCTSPFPLPCACKTN